MTYERCLEYLKDREVPDEADLGRRQGSFCDRSSFAWR